MAKSSYLSPFRAPRFTIAYPYLELSYSVSLGKIAMFLFSNVSELAFKTKLVSISFPIFPNTYTAPSL